MSEVRPLGSGRYLIADETSRRLAYAVADSRGTWVFLDGMVHLVPRDEPGRTRAAVLPDEAALTSPMPATVVDVKVEPGQRVANGDTLVVLEAMKMELAIKSPRDGTVKSIACRPGELVQPGVPLLELE